MSSAWREVCEPEAATSLTAAAFCSGTADVGGSAIDDYYAYVEHLLTLGDQKALDESATLGRLLLLGLVSGVESYFRTVLAELLRRCPIARQHAADQQISFGAIDYYGPEALELGLFDATSLAGADEVCSRTRKLAGIDIPPNSSARAALNEFDKVCHLRHAAVHARGSLGRGNASALGLDREMGRQAVAVSLAPLHDAGAACHSAVRAYNRFVYQKTIDRWLGGDVLVGVWEEDKPTFKPLFDLFHSKRDRAGPRDAYQAFRGLPST